MQDEEEMRKLLLEAWKKVDSAADDPETSKDAPSKGVNLEVVADVGWVAAQSNLTDIATWCSKRALGASKIFVGFFWGGQASAQTFRVLGRRSVRSMKKIHIIRYLRISRFRKSHMNIENM